MSKYYTPDIEEFHVGFEYELQDIENAQWGVIKQSSGFGVFDDDIDDLEEGRIRVKYLDKEDIESLGWKFIGGKLRANFLDEFTLNDFHLFYQYDEQKLRIVYNNLMLFEEVNDTRFSGIIKNKSELKKLMIQLSIK